MRHPERLEPPRHREADAGTQHGEGTMGREEQGSRRARGSWERHGEAAGRFSSFSQGCGSLGFCKAAVGGGRGKGELGVFCLGFFFSSEIRGNAQA